MSHAARQLPKVILEKLQRFDRSKRRLQLLRGAAEAVLIFSAGLIVILAVEWLFRTRQPVRLMLSVGNLALALSWFVVRGLWPWLHRRPLKSIAASFERAFNNRFQERVLFAVELSQVPTQVGTSSWMVDQTISIVTRDLEGVDPSSVLNSTPARRAGKWAAGLVVSLCLACLLPAIRARVILAVFPHGASSVLSRIQLAVTPGNLRVREGMAVDLVAVTSEPVEQTRVLFAWADGFKETVPMSASGTNRYQLTLGSVAQGFRYRVEADDAQSTQYSVDVDVPPRIARMHLDISSPGYTLRSNTVLEGGTAEFLEGSRVRLVIETAGESVRTAEWLPDFFPTQTFRVDKARLSFEAQPTNSLAYRVRLRGHNELVSEPPRKWQWQVTSDLPPVVNLASAAAEARMVDATELLRFEIDAADDVGLRAVDFMALYRDNQAQSRNLLDGSPSSSGPKRNLKTAANFSLADLQLVTGDEVTFRVVATDLKGQTAQSDSISVVVGSIEKALQAQLSTRVKRLLSSLEGQTEQMQQTRSSWLSLARNYRPGEDLARMPAVALLRSRLNDFSQEICNIGSALVFESETNTLPDSRFMYRFGTTLSAWGEQQHDVLLATCSNLGIAASVTNSVETFNLGRGLFSRAITDLEEYRRVFHVFAGALDTEVMAAQCDSARGRYKRALPVLRGEPLPPSPASSTGPGLLMTFYEGIQLSGGILEQAAGLPRLENRAPGGRSANWSCRCEGDLKIPTDGDWTLGCIADDGVRLHVAGKQILPDYAWAAHSPTEFKADLKLTNGWQPISIEFFQGEGTSKLQFMMGRKGEPWQEVKLQDLRPPAARQPAKATPPEPTLDPIVKSALRDRLRSGLQQPAIVPPAVEPLTNYVRHEPLQRLVRDKLPVGRALETNLVSFASWKEPETRQAETQADDLVAFARTAADILRQQLEQLRWRYEGAEALKKIQNAIQQLREIQQELARTPNNLKEPTEEQQMRLDTARVWQHELDRAATQAAHDLFEAARQKEATPAQRTYAYNAAAKADEELKPAVKKLADTLEKDLRISQVAAQMDQRLNEINDRYREINDLQERINRENIAAEALQALSHARAFARAQGQKQEEAMTRAYTPLSADVKQVLKAQRVMGEYSEARKLQGLAGDSAEEASGKELATELRGLASRTENNPPSLAQAIPPPVQQQAKALDSASPNPAQAANALARPRLAISLEAARLLRQGDRNTAAAYDFLGQDLGELLESPDDLTAPPVREIHQRASALAGSRGEQARQRELASATERLKQLAQNNPQTPAALASRLDELANESREAGGNQAKQGPLRKDLGELADTGPLTPDYTQSSEPAEIASGAAQESLSAIQAAPASWESYQEASGILGDAARQIRMGSALAQLDGLTPYRDAAAEDADAEQAFMASTLAQAPMTGDAGTAITQPVPKGLDQADWARLTEQLRQAIRNSGIENFSPEQQSAIRAYFERLSSEP